MDYVLTAQVREQKGTKVRAEGALPAIVYGRGTKSVALSLSPAEFNKLYRAAGAATLIDLLLNGKNEGKVLVQEVQEEPVSGEIIHVDLRRIDMNKEMTATVELKFVGEAPVVKEQGGTLVMTVHSVDVKCLPKDLVSHIDVNLGLLKSYDVVLKVKDLVVPSGLTITKPYADDVVVKASRALTEEEIKAMEESNAQMDVSKIESAKPEKPAEGAEGAEGPAPSAKPGAEKAGADKAVAPAAAVKKP
ncbi:MAG: 50S ribosomal protein L25 [Candidatus Magasanikbacteria bacterium]|nr:50S ribosomal protein L25 [Candidatus Magasanikbacteria bacterium]